MLKCRGTEFGYVPIEFKGNLIGTYSTFYVYPYMNPYEPKSNRNEQYNVGYVPK